LQTASTRLPEKLSLHIFEDSPAGLRGGMLAASMIRDLGADVSLHLWGVSDHTEKQEALQAVGAKVFPDVNQAVSFVLKEGVS
jgi:hypothetical protein